jgi:transglycosylase-like protein with SLT domain
MIYFIAVGITLLFIYALRGVKPAKGVVTFAGFDGPNEVPTETIGPLNVPNLIRDICRQEGYSRPALALAIAQQESGLRIDAYNPEINTSTTSPGNQPDSIGLMQLQFATARKFVPEIASEKDLYNPVLNVKAGVRYLEYLEKKWGLLDTVIQMYNLGETRYLNGSRAPRYLFEVKVKAGYA